MGTLIWRRGESAPEAAARTGGSLAARAAGAAVRAARSKARPHLAASLIRLAFVAFTLREIFEAVGLRASAASRALNAQSRALASVIASVVISPAAAGLQIAWAHAVRAAATAEMLGRRAGVGARRLGRLARAHGVRALRSSAAAFGAVGCGLILVVLQATALAIHALRRAAVLGGELRIQAAAQAIAYKAKAKPRLIAGGARLAAAAAASVAAFHRAIRRAEAFANRCAPADGPRIAVASGAVLLAVAFVLQLGTEGDARGGGVRAPLPTPLESPVAAPGEWVRLLRPVALYGLEAPDIPPGRRSYEALQSETGNGREDVLVFNGFADDKLHLVLRFHRRGEDPGGLKSLFVETARRAALEGLSVERMAASRDMESKFGAAETADALVASGGARRACVAFRVAIGDGAVELGGLACGTEKRPLDRASLACLIDRVSLIAGDDGGLRQAFAAAEMRKRSCQAPRAAASARR